MKLLRKFWKHSADHPDESEATSEETYLRKRKWRKAGIAVQITLFIANGAVWVMAIMAIVGGFIVGLNTKTINIRLEMMDFMITTPATIFITYGMLIVLMSILGCFTATGGNRFMTISFITASLFVLIFDATLGIQAFFSTRSLLEYMRGLRGSMNEYYRKDASPVGIFRVHPFIHWNHLQYKGQCCGLDYYDDWRNTTFGREFKSVPDTCCNPNYEYKTCGNYLFHHPDTEHHEVADIIYTRGCLKIFPEPLVNSFKDQVYVGIVLGAVIIFCLLLAIVLLCMVLCKKYKPGGGPEEWRYVSREHFSGGRYRTVAGTRERRRVGPAGGDQTNNNNNNNNENENRKVSFKGTSQFIPNRAHTTTDGSDTDGRDPKERFLYYNQEKRRNSD